MDDDDRDGEQPDHTELQEGRQIAAWRKQQPYGEDGREPAVSDHECGELGAGVVEQAAQPRALIDPAAARDADQQQYHADDGSLHHSARPHIAHIQPDRDRDRMVANTEKVAQGLPFIALTTTSASTAIRIDHDHERTGARRSPEGPELITRHLPQAASVTAGRHEQNGHILDAPAQHRAEQYPQRSRQISELRGQGRSDQRPGTRNGGEMVSEDDPAMRRHEIAAVIEALGGGRTGGVHRENSGGDPGGVETVADEVNADAGRDQP